MCMYVCVYIYAYMYIFTVKRFWFFLHPNVLIVKNYIYIFYLFICLFVFIYLFIYLFIYFSSSFIFTLSYSIHMFLVLIANNFLRCFPST